MKTSFPVSIPPGVKRKHPHRRETLLHVHAYFPRLAIARTSEKQAVLLIPLWRPRHARTTVHRTIDEPQSASADSSFRM